MEKRTRRYRTIGDEVGQIVMDVEVRVLRKGPQEREGRRYFLEVVKDYLHQTRESKKNNQVGEKFTHWRDDISKAYEGYRVWPIGHAPNESFLQGEWDD